DAACWLWQTRSQRAPSPARCAHGTLASFRARRRALRRCPRHWRDRKSRRRRRATARRLRPGAAPRDSERALALQSIESFFSLDAHAHLRLDAMRPAPGVDQRFEIGADRALQFRIVQSVRKPAAGRLLKNGEADGESPTGRAVPRVAKGARPRIVARVQ